jgi:hypothetical protein
MIRELEGTTKGDGAQIGLFLDAASEDGRAIPVSPST